MPHAPSLAPLLLTWVRFPLVFSTVFQALITTLHTDSGYKTPIQNMDELFASGTKLYYTEDYKLIFEDTDGTEISKIERNPANC